MTRYRQAWRMGFLVWGHGALRHFKALAYLANLRTPFFPPSTPHARQALTRVNPAAYSCLAALSQNARVDVVVISGGDKQRLEEVFGDLHIWLAAENGAVVRPPGRKVRARGNWLSGGLAGYSSETCTSGWRHNGAVVQPAGSKIRGVDVCAALSRLV